MSTPFILLTNVTKPTVVGILTFISMINATSERLKARRKQNIGILVLMGTKKHSNALAFVTRLLIG